MADSDSDSEYDGGLRRTKSQIRKSRRTHPPKAETRKSTRGLERLKLGESDVAEGADVSMTGEEGAGEDVGIMAPPARRGSKSSRARKTSASTTTPAPDVTSTLPPKLKNLPPGVTPEMVEANLRRIEQVREAPQQRPATSQARPQPVVPVEIDPDTLPVGLSVFCNRRLFTRELIFNLKRLNSLETIKNLVKTYFAYEAKRIGLPRDVYFAGIHCVYHRSADPQDVITYGAFMTDYEYQLAHAEIADSKTTTGQILRLQVALYTDAQLADDQEKLKDWFAEGEYDAMQEINGLKWLLDFPDTENPYDDARIFEVDRDHNQVITIPAHLYRENVEKARLGEAYRDNFGNAFTAKAKIRNKEYDLRKGMIMEIRGLRRMLRKEGFTDIDPLEIKDNAREAEDTARDGKVAYAGETQDFKHLKELTKEVEDQSDRINAEEGGVFGRAFLNI